MLSLLKGARSRVWLAVVVALTGAGSAMADVSLPNIFGEHMVLQRSQKNKVWGKASAGEEVTVSIASQNHRAKAGADGAWSVMLDPLEVGDALTLTIKGKNEIKFGDVLVGEVWICSGQSNMQWSINSANDPDLERAAAKHPKLRMINFPNIGVQEPIWSHPDRQWQVCTPETVGNWSAVGYFFARQLQRTLDVPVGMINNAWGGSACEAWVNRDLLTKTASMQSLMERWILSEKAFTELSAKTDLNEEQKKQLAGLQNQMRQCTAGQHLQRRAEFSHRLRHSGGDLVSGGIERGPSVPVPRPVPADDPELARRVGAGRLSILLGAARRLPG